MPSVTVGDFDVNTLSVQPRPTKIGDLRTVDENQIWKLRADPYSMEIGVPRVSHPETRPVICSADLNEANCCCNKDRTIGPRQSQSGSSSIVKAAWPGVAVAGCVFCFGDSHFRPCGGQSDGQTLQNSKVCVDGVMTAHSVSSSPNAQVHKTLECTAPTVILLCCLCAPL